MRLRKDWKEMPEALCGTTRAMDQQDQRPVPDFLDMPAMRSVQDQA